MFYFSIYIPSDAVLLEEFQMRKSAMVVLAAFFTVMAANAQTKITGKVSCAKPETNYSVDVGDRPGHTLMLQKAACTWTTPLEIEGLRSKAGTDVMSADAMGATITERGYHLSNMDNGDKFTVRYQGTIKANKDGSAAFDGKWTFVGGTGKLKGIKGGGSYKGTGAADGGGSIEVEGEYSLRAAKAGK
jgi:hypothetical protein